MEKVLLKDWQENKVSTYDAWMRLGLDKTATTSREWFDSFRIYSKYVHMIDDYNLAQMNKGKIVPPLTGGSDEELAARVAIWIVDDRPEKYIAQQLGLAGLSPAARLAHKNYKHFEQVFLRKYN